MQLFFDGSMLEKVKWPAERTGAFPDGKALGRLDSNVTDIKKICLIKEKTPKTARKRTIYASSTES